MKKQFIIPLTFFFLLFTFFPSDAQEKSKEMYLTFSSEKAFDKYLEIEPHHPNPYDSKGDYYMQNQEYEKAYDSYMKAHALDSGWGLQKAKKVKKMMNQKKSSVNTSPEIKGAWMLVELRVVSDDVVQYSMPGHVFGSHIKMWSDDYFTVVGSYQFKGKEERDHFVAGTYSLDGNRYSENIHYHTIKALIGANPKMIMELKNDTLIQTWPVDDNGKYDEENYTTEKYVRMD